ncbi:hypothetical protein ACJVTN_14165 [Enterobacter hormaechei subsp. xiangfangensis]|nr:hypothetical protein [Enterobacter hormaechei]
MKQKFIEWFIKSNNGCSPAMEDDRSFVREKTQHMFEAYRAGVAEGEARCAALAVENAGLKELIEQHANSVAVCPNCSHEEPSETDDIVALYRSMETPATDAFLAEVRAQGVDMAAKSDQFSTWVQQGLRSFAIGVRQGDEQ